MRRTFVSGDRQVHLFVRDDRQDALRIEVDEKGTTFSRVSDKGTPHPSCEWTEVDPDGVPVPNNLIIERVIGEFIAA